MEEWFEHVRCNCITKRELDAEDIETWQADIELAKEAASAHVFVGEEPHSNRDQGATP